MPTLAERLRAETRALHTAAERSRLMGDLLRGRLRSAAYGALLRNLHPIYAALEPALSRHRQLAALAPLFLPALSREPQLVHDLVARHGAAWADAFPLQPSAAAYAARLHALADTQPELLAAHAYVRYLGDLSGGQALRRIVGASLPLADGAGVSFYDFGDAPATHALTVAFRDGLGRIGATIGADAQDALVSEAKLGFELHQRLFDELADRYGLT